MKRVRPFLINLMVIFTTAITPCVSTGAEYFDQTSSFSTSPDSPPHRNTLSKKVTPPLVLQASAESPLAKPSVSTQVNLSRNYIEPASGMEFLPVPAGCFQMGDSAGDSDEKPVHQVCLMVFTSASMK